MPFSIYPFLFWDFKISSFSEKFWAVGKFVPSRSEGENLAILIKKNYSLHSFSDSSTFIYTDTRLH